MKNACKEQLSCNLTSTPPLPNFPHPLPKKRKVEKIFIMSFLRLIHGRVRPKVIIGPQNE
jgi:hypothetical protein